MSGSIPNPNNNFLFFKYVKCPRCGATYPESMMHTCYKPVESVSGEGKKI